MEARYHYHVERNSDQALKKVEEAINRFSRSPYPLLAKLEIAVAMRNISMISDTLSRLDNGTYSDQHVGVRIKRARILLLGYRGSKDVALSQVDSELGFLHSTARERLRAKILAS